MSNEIDYFSSEWSKDEWIGSFYNLLIWARYISLNIEIAKISQPADKINENYFLGIIVSIR